MVKARQLKFKELIDLPIMAPIALLVGLFAQVLLENNKIFISILFYGIAAILFVVSTRKLSLIKFTATPFEMCHNKNRTRWGFLIGGIAVGLAIISFILFDKNSISSKIPWFLHLVSIGLIIFSAHLFDKINTDQTNKFNTWIKAEYFILLAILALSAFLRFYRLEQIPFGIWYDEADNGLSALKILNEPGYLPLFVESTNLPSHFIFLNALSFKLFGVSTLALRLVSVVFGVATVGAAYFACRQLIGRKTALVFAFLIGVSRWDINWSRIDMHGVSVPFFELLSIGLIVLAIKRQKIIDFVLAGLSIGIGLCFYVPLRIFPVVIGIVALILFYKKINLIKKYKNGILIFLISVLIASIPILKFATGNSELFFARTKSTSIFNSKTSEEALKAIAETTQEHLLMFNYQGDRNGRHNLSGTPMLDPISGSLMVMGLAFCLWRIRQPVPILLILWLLLMLTPGIFSLDFESPQSLRAIGSLPAAYLLAAVAFMAGIQRINQIFSIEKKQIYHVIMFSLLGAAGLINYTIYFDHQSQVYDSWMKFSTPETIIANKMADAGSNVEYYISTFYYDVPTIRLLAPLAEKTHVLQTYDSLPLPLNGENKAILFVDKDRSELISQARRYYPNAEFEEIKAPTGEIILYQITLNPKDITSVQGLSSSYYKDNNFRLTPEIIRKESKFLFNWQNQAPLPFPFGVEWNGVLHVEEFGLYNLKINSIGPIELFIDQSPLTLKHGEAYVGEINLAKGNHAIKLKTSVEGGDFGFYWQPPGKEWAEVPTSSLYTMPITNNGLLGQYYENNNWQGSPALEEIDPWIQFYFHVLPLPRPYTVEWTGKILISEAGLYSFGLESLDESSLSIDNILLMPLKTRTDYDEESLQLETGFHEFKVNYSDHTGYTFINVYWTPPGSDREILPQDVLFIPDKSP